MDPTKDFGAPRHTILHLSSLGTLNQVCRYLFSRFDAVHQQDGWYRLVGALPTSMLNTLIVKTPVSGSGAPYNVKVVTTRVVVVVFKPKYPDHMSVTVKTLYYTDNCRGSQALSFRGYDSVLDLIPENQLVKPDRLGGTDGLVPYPARAYYYFDDKDVQVATHSWPATSLSSEFLKVTPSRFVHFSCTGIISHQSN